MKKHGRVTFLIIFIFVFTLLTVNRTLSSRKMLSSLAKNSPNTTSSYDLTQQQSVLLEKVASRTMQMTNDSSSSMNLWDWEAGIALVGLMKTYEVNRDQKILDFVDNWMKKRIQESEGSGGNKIIWPHSPACSLDNWVNPDNFHPNRAAPVWALLMLYQHRPSQQYYQIIKNYIDMYVNSVDGTCVEGGTFLHTTHQVWDDTLAMSVPLLARYGAQFYQPEIVDRAVAEFLNHAQYLQDPQTGLWYHGWDFSRQSHISNGFWGRGNGWVVITGLELLQWMPENHPSRSEVERTLQRQLVALSKLQDTSGMWHTVVNRPDFYLETSGTSAITSGLLYAAKKGWQSTNYNQSAQKGLQAVYSKVATDGTVTEVSSGTGLPPSIDIYNGISHNQIKPYGQGIFMIMASHQ